MKMVKRILDILYPRRCPVCHDIIAGGKTNVHARCLDELTFVMEPRCKKCGKQIDMNVEYCFDCGRKRHYFTEGYSILIYEQKMQESMTYFKFHGRKEYGEFYGELLLRLAGETVKRWKPEIIIPVPIHRQRKNIRGYNQTEIISQILSAGLSIPIQTNLIKRVKKTTAQKELNIDERKRNMANAFVVNPDTVRHRNVLIVDDIYTTGSTIDEIAKVLLERGVEKVFFVTVCTGSGF